MKIAAIFADYDGTLAPEDASRKSSRVPQEIAEPLRVLGSSIPIAVITSKDSAFVRSRTSFAIAWACVSGLELILSDGRTFVSEVDEGRLNDGLAYVKGLGTPGLEIELKHSAKGGLLAFSVDWRRSRVPSLGFIRSATSRLATIGLSVEYDRSKPYFDVFGAVPDKGRAVRELKRHLKVNGQVIFFGDSLADNPAFDEADVAIGVSHGKGLQGLSCQFALRHEELGPFLGSLAHDRLTLDLNALVRR